MECNVLLLKNNKDGIPITDINCSIRFEQLSYEFGSTYECYSDVKGNCFILPSYMWVSTGGYIGDPEQREFPV